jgi:hypothetical protein
MLMLLLLLLLCFPDSDFSFRFQILDFRFRFQIQISDSEFGFRFQIQIHDADCRFGFQIQISDSGFRFRFQIQISDSDFRPRTRSWLKRSAQCKQQPPRQQRSRAMYRALEQATGGGAPQPAEGTADVRRIALDGQTYTWPQYVEAYGDDAQRCWDEAYDQSILRRVALDGRGRAPQPAESTADVGRIALDGQAFTWPQYVEAYGGDAQRCWDDAYDRSMLRRIALDGQCPLIGVRGSECIQWGCSNLIDGDSDACDELCTRCRAIASDHDPWAPAPQLRDEHWRKTPWQTHSGCYKGRETTQAEDAEDYAKQQPWSLSPDGGPYRSTRKALINQMD